MLDLITDRTDADVSQVAYLITIGCAAMPADIQSAWLSGMKGAYNASDLNRVGAACEYLAGQALGLLTEIAAYLAQKNVASAPIWSPYDASDVDVDARTDWSEEEDPSSAQFVQYLTQYLANAAVLRGLLELPADTPPVPDDMEALTYQEANNIESILLAVEAAIPAWITTAKAQIDYVATYAYQLVSGTFAAGSNRTLQRFSRGR